MSMTIVVPQVLDFGGADLAPSDLSIVLRCTQGLSEVWAVRGQDIVVPGLPGRVWIAGARENDRLAIVLTGWVAGVGADEQAQQQSFRETVRNMQGWFSPLGDPVILTVLTEDGGTGTIECRSLNLIWGPDDIPSFRTLSIELEAVGDDWAYTPAGS